ncbi:sugar phosphate nucleotidyltransferase [Paenibacillus thermoaerophilus]|uniref:Glucose-1-phosphate thymidylyltransferase n=1 Tax=Paenibacillus thermoaerophilus TaxID=1215385 RepID=A0ABW2V1P7_9BACL|nr:sugar phosphate nucleotidyltransferase [Paenibacillus thermoaerophilus]TMV17720.1 spore coat protein [Paenibacillus thermoaerophilus]
MKGIVLAGGTGSRLKPLTDAVNKHLLPVGRYPMIHYGLMKLKQAGITDILIVVGTKSVQQYAGYLGSGSRLGLRLAYLVQDSPGGIAQGLSLAEPFVAKGEKLLLLLGDNLFDDDLGPYVAAFERQPNGARVLLKQVADPSRYGVPILERGRIAAIEEKPAAPRSNYCVTGIYMYDSGVFDEIRHIRPSGRGELEITDVNNRYAARGELEYDVLGGWWIDAGTHEALQTAARRLSGQSRPGQQP